jgi:transcriptional regulator with XRE-family HTH domain
MKETLGEYVKRMTQQKGLSLRELERRSGGRVTGSHLSKIVHGSSKNITVETVIGLALGLDVNPHEVFSIASGYIQKEASEADSVDPLVLADAVKTLATKPQLLDVIREWSRMGDKEQKIVFDSMRFVNERGKGKDNKKH